MMFAESKHSLKAIRRNVNTAHRPSSFPLFPSLLILIIVLVFASNTSAATITHGSHYLTSGGGFYPFPPPIGLLTFEGNPFGPGNTDTVYERMSDVIIPGFGIPVSTPITMTNVGLRSSAPLNIGGFSYDVRIGLTPFTGANPNTGTMTITQTSPDDGGPAPDGIYDTNVNIFFTASFIPTDGGPALPSVDNHIFILSTSPGLWSFDPEPQFVTVTSGPTQQQTTNFFLVGTINMLDPVAAAGGKNASAVEIPEPSTLTLFSIPVLILCIREYRRKTRVAVEPRESPTSMGSKVATLQSDMFLLPPALSIREHEEGAVVLR
jgi:hypothetical protein